jgi:hypothetical protein
MIAFSGQLPIVGPPDKDREVDDFRNVPRSDRGNRGYKDRGQLGGYQTDAEQFPNPKGVVTAYDGGYDPATERQRHGYGIDEADIVRGFCKPELTEDAAYDKENYTNRSTVPRHPDEDQDNADRLRRDWEFRSRNREARGFLTRPRIPSERG